MAAAKPPLRSLFFALQPDDGVDAQLLRAAQQARAAQCFAGVGRPAHTLHLTLQFLGAHAATAAGPFPPGLVRGAISAAASIAFPAFEFLIDRVDRLGHGERTPCVLRTAEGSDAALRRLHELLGDAMRAAGLGRHLEKRDFVPHVTLAYARTRFAPLPLAEPIRWPVREFALLESHIGLSLHNRLAAWPLDASPP